MSFNMLPFELREMIYDSVYTCKHVETRIWDRKYLLFEGPHQNHVEPETFLALLLVNHQVSEQAAVNFFGKRTFGGQIQTLLVFLQGIGPRRRALLRSVVCRDAFVPLFLPNIKISCTPRSLFGLLGTTNVSRFEHFTRSEGFDEARKKLIDAGIMQLSGRIEVVVHVDHGFNMTKDGASVLSSTTWRCEKNQRCWHSEEQTVERYGQEL